MVSGRSLAGHTRFKPLSRQKFPELFAEGSGVDRLGDVSDATGGECLLPVADFWKVADLLTPRPIELPRAPPGSSHSTGDVGVNRINFKEVLMKDQVRGKAEEIKGKVTGDRGEETKGKARQAVGKLKRTVRDVKQDLR
jgi:uncharacterized protein YjbJ (UPF0337 family)